jgi:quercetin dioxygenase-like cupin family protein
VKVRKFKIALLIAISLGIVFWAVIVYAQTTNVLSVGTISHSQLFDGPATVTVRTLTVKPGEVVPWHYHPGHAFNVVKSGTLTLEDGCGRVLTLTPGQGFEAIDGRVHRPKNLGDTDVVVYDTFVLREGKPTTVNLAERRCGPPNDVDECQNDGWRKFNHPQTFINQRRCVNFVRRRPRNVIPHS